MSELKTNQIATNDGNNVAIDNSLNLKSYSTTDRNSLTAAAGDLIYNSTVNKVQFYNGSAWDNVGLQEVNVDYLVIAGGGSGATQGGGGGAGGYRASYNSEASGGGGSSETAATIIPNGTQYTVTVGAGGTHLSLIHI